MSLRDNQDFYSLLTPPPSRGVQFGQGVVLTWDNQTLGNTIEWRGITLTDVSIIEGVNALTIQPGDIVGMLGWAPDSETGVGSWWIIGKISVPGEIVADLDIQGGFVRFRNPDGSELVFIGGDTNGVPLFYVNYPDGARAFEVGGSGPGLDMRYQYAGYQAFQLAGEEGSEFMFLRDPNRNFIVTTDAVTQTGLAEPRLAYRMVPGEEGRVVAGQRMWPSTTSTTLVRVWYGINPIYHPRIFWGLATANTGGTTGWELRITTVDGTTVLDSGTSSTTGAIEIPGWGDTVRPGDSVTFEVWGRNSTGDTSYFNVDRFHGAGS